MTTLLSLNDFKHTPAGRQVAALLERPDTIGAMEQLSGQGRPAVLAIDRALREDALDDTEKRHVGRWIREVLGDRGWKVAKRLHFRSGRIFSSGAVYERREQPPRVVDLPPSSSPAAAERVRRVQEMMRPFRGDGVSIVDEFIAERHAEAARETGEA